MALQQRTVINKAEVLANGNIDVREANDVYDDSITPVSAYIGKDGPVGEITDVVSSTYHRYVVKSADHTPSDVQEFLDNSKA